MDPAEEQARRDFLESQRKGREAEERARAENEAREMEIRKLREIEQRQIQEQARLVAERSRRNQGNHPSW